MTEEPLAAPLVLDPALTMGAAKRVLDVIGALLAAAAAAPVVCLAALMVRLEDGGPVFFVQQRCGQDGRLFTMYKLRTMRVGAEAEREALQARNEVEGPVFKIADDPRLTRVGRLLRRSSVDELPQLVNVLRGEMSLVGPRPALPAEVHGYEPWQRRRLCVRPGITGLWQTSGRSLVRFRDGVRLDLHYIDHWSLRLDLWLLARTVPAVLRGTGAQ